MGVAVSGGFRELDPKKLTSAIERSLDTVGILLEGEVISRANENVDTGRHKGSITWKTQKSGSGMTEAAKSEDMQSAPTDQYEVHIGTAVHYAPHLEYGHKKKGGGSTQAYPHFRSAFDENLGKVKQLFSAALSKFVGKSI
jgi:hypothetical protein